MTNKTKTSLMYNLIFSLLFFSLCFFYDYFNILNQPADGIHVWRQTDGLSMALKYYEDGNGLFEPKMHNQLNNNGKAVGEFPIMFYLVGKLYHVFGVHHWVYRGLWWLISFIGYFFLFKFCSNVLKNKVWGILISLFTFTSPILIIYGISFISDPIALSFLFISFHFIYNYISFQRRRDLFISFLFVSLAGVIKITTLIPVVSLFAVVLLQSAGLRIKQQITTVQLIKTLIPFVACFAVIAAWYMFASHYNKLNNTTYFFLRFAPLWELSSEEITHIKDSINGWSREYFYESGRHILYAFALLILVPFFLKTLLKKEYLFYLLSLLGFFSFAILFFAQFKDHDYYVVGLTFIIPLTALFFVKKFSFIFSKHKFLSMGVQVLFSVLLIACVIHASKRSKERFAIKTEWLDLDLYELRNELENYGISKDDLAVVPHDPSPNITLYAINMKGWSKLNDVHKPEVLAEKIEMGAKWMIVSDERFYNDPIVEKYKGNLTVDFKGIKIYRLTN